MTTPELLSRLGLSTVESKLFLVALERGPSTVSELSRATTLHRPAVYKLLPKLIEKELLSESIRGKRSVYIAESPEKLRLRVEETTRSFETILPELMALYQTIGTRPVIKIFSGKKGIMNVYDDMMTTLKKGDVFYRYESHKNYRENRKYLPPRYFERTGDSGDLDRYIITNELTGISKKPRLGRSVKIVPASYDLFAYDISQIIYADKVAFIDFGSQTAYILESATFARFQRQIFRLLFDKI